MAQHTWYYQNESGIDYHLSIYHGDQSGHVLIYSNAVIITIDFSVKASKNYSFYLGEELFELKITEDLGKFKYSLYNSEIEEEIKEPGKQRNYPTQDIIKAVLLIVFIANLVLLLFLLL